MKRSNNKVVRPPRVTTVAQKIVVIKNYLAELLRQVGIEEEANISLLSKVVAAVLSKVAETEGCEIKDLLGEIRVVKPTPSDPAVMFRGRVIVWWL